MPLSVKLLDTIVLASWAKMDDPKLSVGNFLGVPFELRCELLNSKPGGEEISTGLTGMLKDAIEKEMFTNDSLSPYTSFSCSNLASDILDTDKMALAEEEHFNDRMSQAVSLRRVYKLVNDSASLLQRGTYELVWMLTSTAIMPERLQLIKKMSAGSRPSAKSYKAAHLISKHIFTSKNQAGYITPEAIARFEKVARSTFREVVRLQTTS